MTRREAVNSAYNRDVPVGEDNILIIDMNHEAEAFVNALARDQKLAVVDAYYFFQGRVGTGYDEYPFNWAVFRDFAGPLLRHPQDSVPIVLISSPGALARPTVMRRDTQRPHYEIVLSPACSVIDVVNVWLETAADAKAIPLDGGEKAYSWFFEHLKVPPASLSAKAKRFVNSFAT